MVMMAVLCDVTLHERAKIRDKKNTARNLSSALPVKVDCL